MLIRSGPAAATAAATSSAERLAALRIDVGDHDIGAARTELPYCRFAKSGGATRDECRAALNPHGLLLPF
jgi:hypothetical protein